MRPKAREKMLSKIEKFVRSEDGMEMVEWSIVGVVFAVAAAAFWTQLSVAVDGALNSIEAEVTPAAPAP